MVDDVQGLRRYRDIVDDWQDFAEASLAPLPVCIWTNTLRTSPDRLASELERQEMPFEPVAWYHGAFKMDASIDPGNKLPYIAGLYHAQEEVSLLPIAALGPSPGHTVLDLCAAPGNKTVQTAVALENRGTIIANDRRGVRLNVLRTATHRLGVTNVSTTVADAATFPLQMQFDCVIADVPCSCEGTSRKHPDVMWRACRAQSRGLQGQQRAILARAADLVRPGGRIVYATCTYAPEENEAVVDLVVRDRPDLQIVPFSLDGLHHATGLPGWGGQSFVEEMKHAVRVWPHQNDSGGFFTALLEKRHG